MHFRRAQVMQAGAVEGGVTGLGRNALWRYAALGASSVEGLVVAGVALRRLGATGYGAFAIAATTVGLLGTIDFGLSLSVIRSVARDHPRFGEEDRAQARKDVSAAHATYAGCGLATLLATGLIVWLLPLLTTSDRVSGGQDRLTILLVGVSIAIFLSTAVFDGIPAGRSRFGVTATAAAAGATANIAFVVLAIGHLHLVALGGGQLLGTIIQRLVGGAWISRREAWFRLLPRRVRRADLRRVAMFTLPLLVLSVGGQLIATTDLVVIGAISTAAAVALFRVGSLAPNQLVSVIYTGFDATFPSLSANSSTEVAEADIAFLTRLASYASGVAFGAIVMLRTDVVTLIVGHSDHLATTVLIIFAAVWISNVPVHGLALLLIARARHRTFIPLVAVEAIANIVLTIVFVYAFGAVGAAVATLVTIVVSNDVVFPMLVRREFTLSPFRVLWGSGVPAIAVGVAVSIVGVLPFYGLHPGIVRLSLGVIVGAVLGIGLGYVLLGRTGREKLLVMLRKSAADKAPGPILLTERQPI
jgi:O-antigen/teichoic acid export membrane protein